MEMYIFALNLTCMEQINTIDKISAVYRNTAEEARQELNKVQQKIYRIGSLRLLLFVAGVVGIIYFWSESWGILACIALITLLPFLFLMKYHNRLFHRKDYLEKKMEINEQELAALDYDTSSFDDGEERERTILPIFVRRSASGNKFPPESRSSVIVLNFMALNIRAFFPGRSWVKKTPAPLLVKWRKIIRRSNMGQITNRTIKTITKSNPRFNPLLYISL